ncbi:MAG TPA: TonB-dependent receptor [Terracidiphilus sp.]|nr:TonB-dependent receptor [Terracidiphilus sp.]
MLRVQCAGRVVGSLLLSIFAAIASGQSQDNRASVTQAVVGKDLLLKTQITVTVADENGVAVPDAQVTIAGADLEPVRLSTDYAGHCTFALRSDTPYQIHAEKPGFYRAEENGIDVHESAVKVVLIHEQIVQEQVNVAASTPGIDTKQTSDQMTMNTPEIVNIPYQTSRDIRYLLPFYPGVVSDASRQVHVAGSEAWETLYKLDGFDIRSPVRGTLDMRVSPDAVRSIDAETTRYPVEFGRATGGVVAFYTGMGDNKFRFNATNFIPSFRSVNGIRFDKFVPRFTFSGPLKSNRTWFYDGLETEYDNIYISELPANANTDSLLRGSNLLKVQSNLTRADILTAGLLVNDYHSPYEGISALTPQQSTTNRDVLAWLPYVRNQWSFRGGALLDVGVGVMRFRDGHEPHGNDPYKITPELAQGSYFENLTGRSQRVEGTATLYLPARQWAGQHDLKAGMDLDHIAYDQDQVRALVSYLREDRTLARRSVFAPAAPFRIHNDEIGAYLEDQWQMKKNLLVEPGLRFDWDSIIRRALVSPRIAVVYSPTEGDSPTKISAGIGLYYEHTQLQYLAATFAGTRSDTFYQADGVTPAGPSQETRFIANGGTLREPRALNWSVGVERKLPGSIIAGANFLEKRTSDGFTFANQSGPAALLDDYQLTNGREDRYHSFEIDARRLFANEHTVYVAYTHSSARTNAALNYWPTPSPLGPQQSGPLSWDTPNRILSWGWLPVPLPKLRRRWDFVYLVDCHTGFPFTSVNAAQRVIGAAGSRRFPEYVNFSPGLEWKFHFHGAYYGLRGVIENGTGSANPAVVNNVVDSPEYGTFSQPQGRALTARIRLIGAK